MKIESADPGESDIEHDAAGNVRPLEMQKFFRCTECLHIQLDRANKAVQRLPDRGVVVDDEHDRLIFVHITHLKLLAAAIAPYALSPALRLAGEIQKVPPRWMSARPS